jgi:aryl-alcohol dehydrogenase-like predicted oxidoreductase
MDKRKLDAGIDLIDTGDFYGHGQNAAAGMATLDSER